ncbi:hypothetical protein Aab01nite_10450 [Paractinoplanes abujensis]|uniref:Ricin B lectin domain-containing protein n=1 Tax=Paractinoplanes abujensis TaxID=882441 RepID=A0A7W7CQN6_9ACTN|nr:hypothetical protein [Actinoplanes abujensis]MBB4691131.1 hypothetical protein [Actinoplanes abujensis]GID17455.1 hypothetical protein Aab01nite_10450 [Actinoplanes abujensis]
MRNVSRLVPAAAVLSGLLLTSACANGDDTNAAAPGASSPATAAPSASADSGSSPAPSASPEGEPAATRTATKPPTKGSGGSGSGSGSGGVFSGTRQVLLLPKNSESTLGVVQQGKIGLSEKFGPNDLFVIKPLTPGGDRYWIQTAKLRNGSEPFCLSAKLGSGGKPAAVTTTSCDAARTDQAFRFRKVGESNGKPTYTIYTGRDTFIIRDETGEIAGTGTGVAAVQIGEGTPDIDTPFVIADKGKATMPALD